MANRIDMIIEGVVRRELRTLLEKSEKKDSKYEKSDNGFTGGSRTMMSHDAEEELIDKLSDDFVNLSAVAHKMYPDHTREGAQSQLRKKINHEESDSGAKYHLSRKEGARLKSILNHSEFV